MDNREELYSEIRNRLTLPLTVLKQSLEGKEPTEKAIRLAIADLERLNCLTDREGSDG